MQETYKDLYGFWKPLRTYRDIAIMPGQHVSVADAAALLGVHPQRVHQRIRDGSLVAEKIGHQWAVDLNSLRRVMNPASPGRPLSAKSAWDLLSVAMHDGNAAHLDPSSRSRARSRLRSLLLQAPNADLDETAALLAHLLRNRADRALYVASPRDIPDVSADPRIHPSGVSLPDSNMSAGDTVEGYVASSDLRSLEDDYLLSPSSRDRANVILHVVAPERENPVALDLDDVAQSALVLAADLAEHDGARERREAMRLINELDAHMAHADARDQRRRGVRK